MAFMARRENVLQRNARHRPAKLLDVGERPIDSGLTTIGLGDDAGDRLAVPSNDQCFAALNLIQKTGQFGLGL